MTDPWRPLTDDEIERDVQLHRWLRRRRRRYRWMALFTALAVLLFLAARNAITAIWG